MGMFGKNSFFDKPLGTGSGSVGNILSPSDPGVGAKRHTIAGFDPGELKSFMQASGTVASSVTRADVEALAPTEKSTKVTTKELNRIKSGASAHPFLGSPDQLKGFISAFKQRQDEVFSRRAQPGISQTRLV